MTSSGTLLSGPAAPSAGRGLGGALHRLLRPYLRELQVGTLTVTLPSGTTIRHQGVREGPEAVLMVRRWRALWWMMFEGAIGLARAYIEDDCRSPDLKALLDFGMQNEGTAVETAWRLVPSHLHERIRHARRANTRRGSRRNIAAHYDLGNDFYRLWLDAGMNYSCARYGPAAQTLEQAQEAKLDRVAELLEVQPEQRVLEIGCGWGPLAERLIERHGCRLTGLTLSTEQLEFARARLSHRGMTENAELRLQDYRDIEGGFDRVVSIEMLEAVGEHYWPTYFAKLRQALTETGIAVLQAITIAEARFADYRRQPDFIQRYIFPGGMLPSPQILKMLGDRFGVPVIRERIFGQDYAKTLAAWRNNFRDAWPNLRPLGFDDRFRRLWEYYLSYCEAGFLSGNIDVRQVVFAKSR